MRTPARFYAFLAITLLAGAGCDHPTHALPAGPSAPAAPAPAIPAGRITVMSARPEPGATLTADLCDGGYCVDARFTFEVQVDRDVAEPWVTASFYNGSQPCANSGHPTVYETLEPLRADSATTFTVWGLGLSNQDGTLCRLPQTTTTMIVRLWDQRGRSSTPLLTREFAHSYTFTAGQP